MNPEPKIATELAPSEVRADQFVFSRVIGLTGLACLTAGTVGYVSHQYREIWIPLSMCLTLGLIGLAMLLFHAIRDSDIEIRRVYGVLGGLLILVGMIVSIIPGKPAEGVAAKLGYHFLPWGALCLVLGLLFVTAFLKNETMVPHKELGQKGLLAVGGLVMLVSAYLVPFQADTAVIIGPCLGVLGLCYLISYFSDTNTSTGLGREVAVGVGLLGVALLAIALGLTMAPTVLYEGPVALKNVSQQYDRWKVIGRLLCILVGLSPIVLLRRSTWPHWVRTGVIALGLLWSALFIAGSFSTGLVTSPPKPVIVPQGFTLAGLGLLYLIISVAVCSESTFVTLTKREFTSFLYSPMMMIVFIGATLLAAVGYYFFFGFLTQTSTPGMPAPEFPEPIVRQYLALTWLMTFQVFALVPLMTMRTLSEEKRSGTLEVLLTAPVNESTIVLSKFVATFGVYLLSWIPATAFLIAFRASTGQYFDYKPLLSYYLVVIATGVWFIGIGMFFSALTTNQIVAGVMTFAVLIVQFMTMILPQITSDALPASLVNAISKLSYFTMWNDALSGSIRVSDLFLHLSMGILALFLTWKVLEIRKWS